MRLPSGLRSMPLHGLSRRQPQRMLELNALDSSAMTRFARCFVPRREILRCSPSQSVNVISATFLCAKAGRTNVLNALGVGLGRCPPLAGVLLNVPLGEARHRRRARLASRRASGSLPLARSSSFNLFASALAVASGQSG